MERTTGTLWDLVRGTAALRGDEFFRELTRLVARAIDVPFSIVSGESRPSGARTLAVWAGERWEDNFDFDVAGSPCERVYRSGRTVHLDSGLRDSCRAELGLEAWAVDSYLGTPLVAASGAVIGSLCVMDRAPIRDPDRARAILEPFAARAATELERIWTERELERQRAFLRQVLDVTPCFIFAKDREGAFRLVNRAVADTYGTTPDGLLGKTDADFNPKADEVAFFRKMDLDVMDTLEERRIAEESVTDATGRVHWLQTTKRPIVGEDGRADLVLGVSVDVTELREAREQLLLRQMEERRKVQEELDRAKDELVRQTRLAAIGQVAASVAHELRNPLGAINNALFYLRRQIRDPETKIAETLDIVGQEVHAADRIISDLLEMSRGKSPNKVAVDLGEVARRTFDDLRIGPPWTLDLGVESEPFLLHADPDQLRQVLFNLMTNAIQAMPEGGRITIEARRETGVDVLTVRDDGPGVPEELRARVFEPLFSTKTKGTGLGLTICRQIVEAHGGAIWVVPADRGAAIRIRLPARPPNNGASG
jgi:PAS domain S-box-containing protein